MAILQVNKVSKLFGANPEQGIQLLEQGWSKARIAKEKNITVGVNRVSFDIHEGEIFVIMGLSGAGKSTLVRLLNRLIEPTSGEILIHGKDLRKMNKEQAREVRRKNQHGVPEIRLVPSSFGCRECGVRIGNSKGRQKQAARSGHEVA